MNNQYLIICHYFGTQLTDSFYAEPQKNINELEKKAYSHFFNNCVNDILCPKIEKIEVFEKGTKRFDEAKNPIFVQNYA